MVSESVERIARDSPRRSRIGLYGFDVRGPALFRTHYWANVLNVLRQKVGADVIVTGVPGCVAKEYLSLL